MINKLVLLNPDLVIKDFENLKGSFSLIESGLECPYGDDYYTFIKNVPKTLFDNLKDNDWVFIIRNEKKWLLTKIKYGI